MPGLREARDETNQSDGFGIAWRTRDCGTNPYRFVPGRFNGVCDYRHFWSPHSGGATFAFGDGSVRFLAYSADRIMEALATRAGREPLEW